ncbi:MAG: hypothetical protein ACKO4A_06320 [Gammaproteobacteria bacterium]
MDGLLDPGLEGLLDPGIRLLGLRLEAVLRLPEEPLALGEELPLELAEGGCGIGGMLWLVEVVLQPDTASKSRAAGSRRAMCLMVCTGSGR